MKINLHPENDYVFYETEIDRALDWLYRIRDEERKGWAWVQFIRPNEQNTAEVVLAYAENDAWFDRNPEKLDAIMESIDYWLIDTSHASISIDYCWVARALQVVRANPRFMAHLDAARVQRAIDDCLTWLQENQIFITHPADAVGWGDNSEEIPNVIRTALALLCFQEELTYLKTRPAEEQGRVSGYEEVAEKACTWLLASQNKDGGWGNLDAGMITQEYQRTHSFSYEDLKHQCDSNPASTGYVVLALARYRQSGEEAALKRASEYLIRAQEANGAWEVFTEIGVRNGERYTFRHFGTTWALQGLMQSGLADYRDEVIIHGFAYLSHLQDENYGGWKSSPDADNYTWATCNALSTINMLKDDLAQVHAGSFLSIVWDWWSLRKKDANFSFNLGGLVFAFNGTMALSFCIVFSVMITLILFFVFSFTDPILSQQSENLRKLVYSTLTVISAVVLGLPWIVYVKNRFRSETPDWIESIGWVYGIITGFVLVFYQFIL